jgi:hypothetical protein
MAEALKPTLTGVDNAQTGGDLGLKRHSVLQYVFGVQSTGLLADREVQALLSWLELEPGSYTPKDVSAEECRQILATSAELANETKS